MKTLFLIMFVCAANILHAQDTAGIKVIPADALKKYHIGIAKTDTNTIQLAKNTEKPWSQMNTGEKVAYIINVVINDYRKNYPFTFWILVTLLSLWIFKQIAGLVKKFNQQ